MGGRWSEMMGAIALEQSRWAGQNDVASLGVPGRFGSLAMTIEDDVLWDEFFDCPCDGPGFRFIVREERRSRQQERRKQEGQQRRGRTARKRAGAVNAAVMRINGDGTVVWRKQSHEFKKRLCIIDTSTHRIICSKVYMIKQSTAQNCVLSLNH